MPILIIYNKLTIAIKILNLIKEFTKIRIIIIFITIYFDFYLHKIEQIYIISLLM